MEEEGGRMRRGRDRGEGNWRRGADKGMAGARSAARERPPQAQWALANGLERTSRGGGGGGGGGGRRYCGSHRGSICSLGSRIRSGQAIVQFSGEQIVEEEQVTAKRFEGKKQQHSVDQQIVAIGHVAI
eukprot:748422-Hanusia_phi.AAC.1